MWKLKSVVVFLWCALLGHDVIALENGLARTPPMGWISLSKFNCITDCDTNPDECFCETLFRRISDEMVSQGYKDKGYEYIIIDDCWVDTKRDSNDEVFPDLKRFPNGMKSLADYIHAKGMKFGIVWEACAISKDDIRRLKSDARTLASWNVDYIKLEVCEACHGDVPKLHTIFTEFGRFLRETKRPIVYACFWPAHQVYRGIMPNYEIVSEHCNTWRNFLSIHDSWESLNMTIEYFAQPHMKPYAGPGHWNDPDMLIVGNGHLSVDQSKKQMAIWAIIAAPLIMSNDLKVQPVFKEILQNREIIKVNQDPLGIQGLRMSNENQIEIWVREITPIVENSKSLAVAFISNRNDDYSIDISPIDLGLKHSFGYSTTDLYDGTKILEMVVPNQHFSVHINSSGVLFYKLTPRTAENHTEEAQKPPSSISPWFFIAIAILVILILCILCFITCLCHLYKNTSEYPACVAVPLVVIE